MTETAPPTDAIGAVPGAEPPPPTATSKPGSRLGLLFAPGERLGWIFRDRGRFRRPFPDPPPLMPPVPEAVLRRHHLVRSRLGNRIGTTVGIGLAATFVLACVGGCIGESSASASNAVFTLSGLAFLGTAAAVGFICWDYISAGSALRKAQQGATAWHSQAVAEWQHRRATFDRAEHALVDGMVEWGAARTPEGTRRVDVFGGTLWGWESFLTVFGGSMMGTRGALTVLDLSGESVCAELVRLSTSAGAGVELQRLPADLPSSDLLVGLDQRQLVDALVESMHGDGAGANRADRAMDDRLLTAICGAIAPDLSFQRLTAAIHTVMGEPGIRAELTGDERLRLADDLFSAEYRRQAQGHLQRIDSFLYPLRDLGSERIDREPGFLSCVTLDSDGHNARGELLVDLVVQWATRRMLSGDAPQTLAIAGADDLQRRHVERLSDICERRNIRLVLLFRHLREASLHALGGGAVAFMRLGNHEEATRAADFVGRQHKFVLSQLTRTQGGNETHGETDTEGRAETESLNIGTVNTSFRNWGRGGSSGHSSGEGGGSSSYGSNWSRGGGSSTSTSRTQGWSTTRNWSHAESWTAGTNWADATTDQRVYEYAVEPSVLQHLPDHALLLVESRPGGPVPVPVECDPAIITLPRSSHEPLPPPPHPAVPPARVPVQHPTGQFAAQPVTTPLPTHPVSGPPGHPVSGPAGYPVSAPPGYPVSAPPGYPVSGAPGVPAGPMAAPPHYPPTPPHGWPQQR